MTSKTMLLARHVVLVATLALAATPVRVLANHSEPTLIVVSGRQVVRGNEEICFRLDRQDIASDRLSVRLLFRGEVPRGRVTLDGHQGPEFDDDQGQVFSFRVNPRGIHRLSLELRETAVLDSLTITSTQANIEQVACHDYEIDDQRQVDLETDDPRVIDRLERRDGEIFRDYDWDDPPPRRAGSDGVVRGAVIPAGTQLPLVLDASVGTNTHRAGHQVVTHLDNGVRVGGRIVLPAGTRVIGHVVQSQEAGRFGRSRLRLDFGRAMLDDGTSVVFDGSIEELGRGSAAKQGGIIAGSAVGGAIAGKLLGGDDSDAVLGAVVGGGIAAGAIASRPGKSVVLPAGTVLLVRLETSARVPDRTRRR